ncbi:MAG: YkgJ family cysteine cluster protein [Desulfovermiculus sp.]|nr:YkgJ family cysteine cluster protein [Desulfovermiculus sp.]
MPDVFICRMCGQCCQGQGGIVLTAKDMHRLAKGLGLTPEALIQTYVVYDHKKPVLTSQVDGTCIFFQSQTGCTVHAYKPDVCRAWPFFRGNLEDEASWRMAQEYCPGINPDIPHQEFVCQGLEYIHQHGLVHPQASDSPSALITGHLWETYPESPKN